MRKKLFEEDRVIGSDSEPSKSEEDGMSVAAEEVEGEYSEPDDHQRDGTYEPGSENSSETGEDMREHLSPEGDRGEQDASPSTIHPTSPMKSPHRDSEAEDSEVDRVLEKRRRIKDLRYNTGRESVRRGRTDEEGRFVWIGRRSTHNNNLKSPGDHKPCPTCGKPQPANKSMKRHMTMCERKR